jgi:hypothetical protein
VRTTAAEYKTNRYVGKEQIVQSVLNCWGNIGEFLNNTHIQKGIEPIANPMSADFTGRFITGPINRDCLLDHQT